MSECIFNYPFCTNKCLICVCLLGGIAWAHLFLNLALTASPCVLLIRFSRIKQLIGPKEEQQRSGPISENHFIYI